jgi:phage protein U
MYAQLGSIQFTPIKGFSERSGTKETNFAQHALIDGKPKLQRIGTNLATIEIGMFLDASFCNPQAEIDALNSARENGEILPLIMGNGRFDGNFVIQSVSDTSLHEASDGTLLQAEVSVQLLEYATGDLTVTTAVSAIAQAFGNLVNNPPTFSTDTVYASAEMVAATEYVESIASMNTASDVLNGLGAFAELYRPKAEAVIRDMNRATDNLSDLLSSINADTASEVFQRTRDLALATDQAILVTIDISMEANALIADIDNGNTSAIPGRVTSLIQRATELRSRSNQLSQSASELVSLVVVQ